MDSHLGSASWIIVLVHGIGTPPWILILAHHLWLLLLSLLLLLFLLLLSLLLLALGLVGSFLLVLRIVFGRLGGRFGLLGGPFEALGESWGGLEAVDAPGGGTRSFRPCLGSIFGCILGSKK